MHVSGKVGWRGKGEKKSTFWGPEIKILIVFNFNFSFCQFVSEVKNRFKFARIFFYFLGVIFENLYFAELAARFAPFLEFNSYKHS